MTFSLVFWGSQVQCATSSDTVISRNTIDSTSLNEQPDRRSFFLQFYDDGRYLFSKPDLYILMGGLGSAPFVFPSYFDAESTSLNEKWGESQRAQDFFKYGDWMGQATLQIGLAALNIGIGKLVHSRKMQVFGEDIIHAQGYNALFTLPMKVAVNRRRPSGGPNSYPSGHTSTSFASACVVYSHFGKTWGAVAILGASYVGLSRIAENKHHLSDVIAGAVIGSYVGLQIGHRSNQQSALSVRPTVGSEQSGLALTWRF